MPLCDPEVQVVLPLLDSGLLAIITACVEQRLAAYAGIKWDQSSAVVVVLSSRGYPGKYQTGKLISE